MILRDQARLVLGLKLGNRLFDRPVVERDSTFYLLICLALLAGGCGVVGPPTGAVDATLSPTIAPAQAVEVVDGRGQRIVLEQPADRIVTIPMPSASILMAVDGGPQRLVGMHPASRAAAEEGILDTIYPAALDARTDFIESGFSPNVEELLTMRPDVVFQWAGRGEDLLAPMESVGLTVIGVEYGTQERLEDLLDIKGLTVGDADKAARIIDYHHATMDEIARKAQSTADADRPRVLYFLRYAEQLRVAGADTYNDFYIDLTGGTNVAAGKMADFYDVNAEQIIAWDPEVILLGGFDGAVPADVYNNPLFRSVTAVVDRRVYKVPLGGYRWDPPSHESPLMWRWLANLLHPDVFDYDVRAEIGDVYDWLYGYSPTSADVDGVLRLEINRSSTGYEQFTAP